MERSRRVLSGNILAGSNPSRGRVEHDYYATDPLAVEMLLSNYKFDCKKILEPCVGGGNIANAVKKLLPNSEITGIDLVDRGYPNTNIADFLTYETDERYDGVITNPPYSIAQEFVEKSITLLDDDGKIAMFLKIQFLESAKRKTFFKKYQPKYIYVFSERMATWNNGKQFTDRGKKWSTTMCHAWFIWEKTNGKMSKTEPVVRWL